MGEGLCQLSPNRGLISRIYKEFRKQRGRKQVTLSNYGLGSGRALKRRKEMAK